MRSKTISSAAVRWPISEGVGNTEQDGVQGGAKGKPKLRHLAPFFAEKPPQTDEDQEEDSRNDDGQQSDQSFASRKGAVFYRQISLFSSVVTSPVIGGYRQISGGQALNRRSEPDQYIYIQLPLLNITTNDGFSSLPTTGGSAIL